jgi:nicotinate phosphoribosyltransferase
MAGARRDQNDSRTASVPGLALFTDLYELTMLRAYHALGLEAEAVFSLFVRRLPETRNFLIAGGLDDLLGELEALRFEPGDLTYLAGQGFPADFLEWLREFRFRGDIFAVPEGTPVFANEPILEVVAPIGQGQLIETLVMNQIGFETMIASKAARIVAAADGRTVIDFGGRRAHGLDAALKAARAAFIGGAKSTSSVLAGKIYGIPIAGTMAHSFVEAFDEEIEAFRAFARIYPDTVLLVDTYDTVAGVEKVIALARDLGPDFKVRGIRLDSGDFLALSKEARSLLDGAGLSGVRIVASGGLNEDIIAALMAEGAPIDSFGVGTDLVVSADAPSLDIAYKLTEFAGQGRLKLSTGKRTLPGRKQLFRNFAEGTAIGDVIARVNEALPGTPLLRRVMKGGVRLDPPEPLTEIQARCRSEIARLPAALRALPLAAEPYPVTVSPALAAFEAKVREKIAAAEAKPRRAHEKA